MAAIMDQRLVTAEPLVQTTAYEVYDRNAIYATNKMHAMTMNDDYPAALVRGVQNSSTYSETKSHQATVIRIGQALAYAHKIPVRKSSKTFASVANTCQASIYPTDPQPKASPVILPAATKNSRNTLYRRAGNAPEQTMVVPTRTTSLRELPKTRNRPDALSLHNRSRILFSSIDKMLASSRESTNQKDNCESLVPTRHASVSIQSQSSHDTRRSIPAPEYLARLSYSTERPSTSEQSEKLPHNTALSWTSDETRLMEYEKIDRAHSGLRGLCKDLLPKRWCRGGRRDFFHGECDGDSVRRYRVCIPEKMGVAMIRNRNWSCFS